MITAVETHIRLDERGVAWIDDTNVKVIEVVLDQTGQGLSPEGIFDAHSGYLSLAQIHAALAFYYDHKSEIDAEIERQVKEFDELRKNSLNSPVRQKLRSLGLLP
ncbi:MAG: DUF433 domain-containing protein [Planctomycetaceae bacterium]|nr:DUF433 domain-containing protein [Planctomycetaceae bacterium]